MNWNDTVAGIIPPNLGAELQQTLLAVTGGLTLILIAGVIALIGWLLGALLSRAAQTILSLAGIDAPAKRLATGTGVRPDFLPSRMVGFAVFWLMILATSILALRVLGLDLAPSLVMRLQDVLPRIVTSGLVLLLGIPLAPQFSTLSVQKYMDAAEAALPPDMAFSCVRSFHDHPLLIDAFAEKVRAASPQSDEDVVVTAHSLPQRVAQAGDPYPDEVASTARAVADRCGIRSFRTAYQSAGRTPEPWLGPDLSDVVRARAAAGVRRMLVVPIGFVCDHTEILFDIDVQAAGVAREASVELRRTESLNASPTFVSMLAALVMQEISVLR
jgi:ferrochelatase